MIKRETENKTERGLKNVTENKGLEEENGGET